jgi:phosphomannomutase
MYDHILFDMDGTLTDARQPIDPVFRDELLALCKRVPCHVVTGSDYGKVQEQLGVNLCAALAAVFSCNGNVRHVGEAPATSEKALKWRLSEKQIYHLEKELEKSKFWLRTGNHIEHRIGCVNFSIVGRNANTEQRAAYKFYDQCKGEREQVLARLRKRVAFKGHQLVLGGETGIDIFPEGCNKAQVREHLKGRVLFIGDRCEPGGNDFEIAMACDKFYQTKNWHDTRNFLQSLAL